MKAVYFLLILFSYSVYSQSLSVFDLEIDNIPIIKAKFYLFDEENNQITDLDEDDFYVTENGVSRDIISVSCFPSQKPEPLSCVLVIDGSGSMDGRNLHLAKIGILSWIESLVSDRSECAITIFNEYNYLIQDFTTDRDLLKEKTNDLFAKGGTNYNAALIDPMAGGLQIAKNGKYRKVIVFLTDGDPYSPPQKNRIISEAKAMNAVICCITLNMPCPQYLIDISNQTGGIWSEYVSSEEEVKRVYEKISWFKQDIKPCLIEWMSDIPCEVQDVKIDIEQNSFNIKNELSYYISEDMVAQQSFYPYYSFFESPELGIERQQKVTLTAINSNIKVFDVIVSDPDFKISPDNFELKNGESIDLTISYTPTDSSIHICKFSFENDKCEVEFYAKGGWRGKGFFIRTLELTHPNGGEFFVVGSDTLITWKGISKEEKVKLEYSIDNGKNWNLIESETKGLSYKWKNIPRPASNDCLARVSTNPEAFQDSVCSIVWEKTFGGKRTDIGHSIIELKDQSFVAVGYTYSDDGDVKLNKGNNDLWIIKMNPNDGSLIWEKTYGGSGVDIAESVIQTSDGSLVLAGHTKSNDGDISENKGNSDVWIIKINPSDGSLIWEKTYGGISIDEAYTLTESSDGTIVVAGRTNSNDGDINENKGHSDFWVIKLDPSDGSLIWEKTYGGHKFEEAYSIIESSNGYYFVAGVTNSYNGDITKNMGNDDLWIIKIDPSDGSLIWEKTIGGTDNDRANSIIETSDNKLLIAGWTESSDEDVSINKGSKDFWLVKMNMLTGSIIWEKTYGGSGEDIAESVFESVYGSYIVAGWTGSHNGDVSNNKGRYDFWILNIRASDGYIIWEKTIGGSRNEHPHSIIESKDMFYYVVGWTKSNDKDVNEIKGASDLWIVKIHSIQDIVQFDQSDNVFSIVMPKTFAIDIDMEQVLVNKSKDSVISDFIYNVSVHKLRIDSIYFDGADASAFQLVSGIPEYSIEAGHSKPAEFRFSPIRVGMHYAEIVIETQAETLRQNIQGEGVEPRLEVMSDIIDFGVVDIGDHKDTIQAITIKNISSSTLNITNTKHNRPNDIDFTTLSGGGAFSLAPHEEKKMDLRFTPSRKGRTSGTLEFYYDETGSPAIVQLFGEGYKCEDNIISSYKGSPNTYSLDTVNLNKLICERIKLINNSYDDILLDTLFFKRNLEFSIPQSNLPEMIPGLDSVEFDVCFRAYSVGNFSDTLLFSNICGSNEIPFEVDVKPSVYISESKCGVPVKLTVTKIDGKYYSEPVPNPFSETTEISAIVDEQCDVTISLINIFGKRVISFKESLTPEISNKIVINAEESIANGMYLLAIEGARSLITYKVILVR